MTDPVIVAGEVPLDPNLDFSQYVESEAVAVVTQELNNIASKYTKPQDGFEEMAKYLHDEYDIDADITLDENGNVFIAEKSETPKLTEGK